MTPPPPTDRRVFCLNLKPQMTDVYDFVFEYLKKRDEYDQLIPILERGLKKNPGPDSNP